MYIYIYIYIYVPNDHYETRRYQGQTPNGDIAKAKI